MVNTGSLTFLFHLRCIFLQLFIPEVVKQLAKLCTLLLHRSYNIVRSSIMIYLIMCNQGEQGWHSAVMAFANGQTFYSCRIRMINRRSVLTALITGCETLNNPHTQYLKRLGHDVPGVRGQSLALSASSHLWAILVLSSWLKSLQIKVPHKLDCKARLKMRFTSSIVVIRVLSKRDCEYVDAGGFQWMFISSFFFVEFLQQFKWDFHTDRNFKEKLAFVVSNFCSVNRMECAIAEASRKRWMLILFLAILFFFHFKDEIHTNIKHYTFSR